MSSPVEEIKERLNIVDIVGEYVQLKKTGANHKGRCPFHNEKTPSFTVSESKQFFHCFGCSKGGDVFTFLQEVESMEFAEALRVLAKRAHVELKPTNPREHNERTKLLDALSLASEFFHVALKESKEGEIARTYLTERKVEAETIEQFNIGYSGDSWDALFNFLRKRGCTEKEIASAGLVVKSEKNNKYYDRFRGRLMFPIHNSHGNVIGFGGRTLDPEQKEAKYINSPQSPVYDKSATLYGLAAAKKYIQKVDATVIVEGYMDVVSAHQAKFRNVVAASGTALTHDQIRLLKRYSPNVILAFDSDAAGLSAAWKGMQVAVEEGMNIKVLVLPTGQDPDDLIRANPTEFRERAMKAKPFMEHAFDTITQPLDLTKVHDKKKAAAELLPMIALFPDKIEQTHYIKKLAELVEVEQSLLEEKIHLHTKKEDKLKKEEPQQKKQIQMSPEEKTHGEQVSERLLALASMEPQDFSIVVEKLHDGALTGDRLVLLYNELKTYYNQSGHLDPEQLKFENTVVDATWKELQLIGEELFSEVSQQERQQELLSLIESAERFRIKHRLDEVQHLLSTAERSNDSEAIARLSDEFRDLAESLRQLG